jgi:TonB family protein
MNRVAGTIRKISVCGLLVMAVAMAVHAADAHPSDNKRALKTKVMPEYPELAKRVNIKGAVRLELLVKPDGHVNKVSVLGGNPVLVQAAVEAVKKWRYVPASTESTIVVKLDFNPAGISEP